MLYSVCPRIGTSCSGLAKAVCSLLPASPTAISWETDHSSWETDHSSPSHRPTKSFFCFFWRYFSACSSLQLDNHRPKVSRFFLFPESGCCFIITSVKLLAAFISSSPLKFVPLPAERGKTETPITDGAARNGDVRKGIEKALSASEYSPRPRSCKGSIVTFSHDLRELERC